MSLAAINWAWQHEELDPTEKLVLLAICDTHNGETGVCCPSRGYIARRACVSVRSVSRWMQSLEDRALIRRHEHFDDEGRRRSNDIEVLLHGRTPAASGGVTADKGEGVTADKGEGVTGDKAIEPEDRTGRRNRTHGRVGSVDGTAATELELALADEVLGLWNDELGQKLTAVEWKRSIIRRHREHPELTIADHHAVMLAALGNAWWTGVPTPAVVYGSAAQFERSMLQLANRSSSENGGRADRIREMLAAGKGAS